MAGLQTFDEDTVVRFAREFEQLFYDGKGADMAAYYTENARLIGDGISPIQGLAGIERFWQLTCGRSKELNMKRSIVVDEIQIGDPLSYVVSTLTITLQTSEGKEVTRTISDITIWRKQADGTWQIEVDISNPNPTTASQ